MYRPGWRILASDYNNLIGNIASDQPATSEADAAGRIGAIWGIGYGQYGYGQAGPNWRLRLVGPYERVLDDDWARLQDAVARMLLQQGITSPDLPPPDLFEAGDRVLVHDAGFAPGDWDTLVPLLDDPANRLPTPASNPAGYVTDVSAGLDVRGSSWGGASENFISSAFALRWPTGDHARAYFNAGGEILMRPSHPGGGTANDRYAQLLADIGVINYGRDYASYSGTATPSVTRPAGYWNAPAALSTFPPFTTFFEWRRTSEPWPDNDLRFFAAHYRYDAANVSGNGDNGSILIVECVFGHARTYSGEPHPLSAGTRLDIDLVRPKWLPDPDIIPQVILYDTFDSSGAVINL